MGKNCSPHATAVTAGQQILWGDLHIDLPIAVNAYTIRDGLCSTKRLDPQQQRHEAGKQIIAKFEKQRFHSCPKSWAPFSSLMRVCFCFFFKFLRQFQITELLKSLATCGDIEQLLTQQDPQEPWSLISFRVGQLGHCCLASNSFGSFKSPAYWTLQRKPEVLLTIVLVK